MRFYHYHPYSPFIPEGTQKLIVGTLPPPRFCTGSLKPRDVNFCYGSQDGLLWPILEKIFEANLDYEPTSKAIEQRKMLLAKNKIGICDIVESCYREKIDASDIGMQDVQLRSILQILKNHPTVTTLLLMGGNSRNGPEYFLRKFLKCNKVSIKTVSNFHPKQHSFKIMYPDGKTGNIHTVSLISPSGSANRAIGSHELYKKRKRESPAYTTIQYRIDQYSVYFK